MASHSIAVAVGANLGDPLATLLAVRPLLTRTLQTWWQRHGAGSGPPPPCRWSPLFRTRPVGGPPGQPDYLNAAVLLPAPGAASSPDGVAPRALLRALQQLEVAFGRERRERWGPRSLDLDLLWCGDRRLADPDLELPHPRLHQRRFVLEPLAAIDPALQPPAACDGPPLSVATLLARLEATGDEAPPQRLPPRPGWPE